MTGGARVGPRRANETIRDELRRALRGPALSALELSQRVGVAHKQIDEHLEHVRRSAGAHDETFVIEPALCRACGYEFRDRGRLSRPSRCPDCRSERVEPPRFRLESKP